MHVCPSQFASSVPQSRAAPGATRSARSVASNRVTIRWEEVVAIVAECGRGQEGDNSGGCKFSVFIKSRGSSCVRACSNYLLPRLDEH